MSILQDLIIKCKDLFKRESDYTPYYLDMNKAELPLFKVPILSCYIEIDIPSDDIEWERGRLYRAVYKDFLGHTLRGEWYQDEENAKRELLAYKRGGAMITNAEIAKTDFPKISRFDPCSLKCCIQVDRPNDIAWEQGRRDTLYRAFYYNSTGVFLGQWHLDENDAKRELLAYQRGNPAEPEAEMETERHIRIEARHSDLYEDLESDFFLE